MGARTKLSDAQLEVMCELREKGWSPQRIAAKFTEEGTPISGGAVSWQCLRLGADAPPRLQGGHPRPRAEGYWRNGTLVRPFTPEEDVRLLDLEGQGLTETEIGRALNRKQNSIRGRLLTLARMEARREQREGVET